eukprot:CAMPEP_0175090980 /NCGR_PEP_ID=MMETSP0086_2-20121207/1653_1 /TAXON_ID=136419 /ORGANISM="Unknown Unknown, Strain D1" /LENGTH=272 /DNA_ID=CAMNT_0016363681 /DNA_START=114 /DNA_END=932 /DNA_ORIENTATION=-
MGTGIAWVTAVRAKKNVVVMDVNQTQLDGSLAFSKKLLDKDVAKERITQVEADEAFARISTTSSLEGLQNTDFIIEAATENVDLKKKIFGQLDGIMNPEVILASNTSSISITKLAAATERPDKVIGMHFFSPVPVMKLTELISGLRTSEETLATTEALAQQMGKVTTSSKNLPGFISNRILMPMINEAFFVLGEGIASREDIDTTMKLGTNVPMGPLTLADFIGLDTCLNIMNVLHEGFGDSKYRPAPLLVQYVDAGLMGRKSGQGVYEYKK